MTRLPVLFIPGITGSFNLGVLLNWRGSTLKDWNFPPFTDYGKQLTAAFTAAGYRRDHDFFVAFYDWRMSVKDSATTYLKPWIDLAKKRSGAATVILIGHSMGGLVARSYLQSPAYEDDVAHLITLGTPHRGAADSYYAWGGGEPKSDGQIKLVFDVYLWYLRHAHPFQTELDRLRAMRTLVPGVRDLLPIDGFLLNEGGPALPKRPATLVERNLVGDMLNQPPGLETLLSRVPVTTISGIGRATIATITVTSPPIPPGDPPRFPDGAPVSDQSSSDGDGTVLRSNAQVDHPQVNNSPPLHDVGHGTMPDHPATIERIFASLQADPPPVLGGIPVTEPRLVIMTASPVTMQVEMPTGRAMQAPTVLGGTPEQAPTRRKRVIKGRDHGHQGKHLNMVVIPQPVAGSYSVHVTGTATGVFAVGAMLIGGEEVTVLGGSETSEGSINRSENTSITTRHGQVAAGTELFFAVDCQHLDVAPAMWLDKTRTMNHAVERLRTAMQTTEPTVLGGGSEGDEMVNAAMRSATEPSDQVDALCNLAEHMLGPHNEDLAEAVIMQLRAVK
ncbi:permease [Candidatus Chloroploca sp. M-50]|uniref:Permease n=1 Tax=Candidatus Chloroploca mongolica TaxID=2528176 RepID=A0ABS4DA82_9CHLR|nr:permease [Candidatus Chloroploca mongolica]MBP1466332.1 permease [Candidatus Chloroploca mongolica]